MPKYATITFSRREVLRKWKSKQGFRATYKRLLETLFDAKHMEGAEAVRDVLKKKGTMS